MSERLPYEQLEDEKLIDLLRSGDTAAEETLYARHKQTVLRKARTYFLVGADREDIIQEGMIGLHKAVCDYRSMHETSFRVFAELCIKRQIISAVKSATRKKHLPLNTYVSLNRTVTQDEDERALIDVLESSVVTDPEEMLIGREKLNAVARGIKEALTPLERRTLGLYLAGHSYRQIADALGRQPKSVDNAIQRVKRKLEECLKNE